MLVRRCSAACAGALLSLMTLAGCSGENRVLARVGPHVVTVDDFVAAARSAQQSYPGPPDSAKARLLEDLVRRELLLCGAEAGSQPRDSVLRRYRATRENELLAQEVHRRLSDTYTPVTEAEVRRFYARRDSATHLKIIYAYTRAIAQAALDEIRRTSDFAAVAARYNPTVALPPDGDLGRQTPGDLIEPLDSLARCARPGSLIGPIEVPTRGWFLVQVLERQPRSQPPFEAQRVALTEMLRQRKQQEAAATRSRRLRDAYAVRLVEGGGQVLFAYFNPPGGTPPNYSAPDLARPLARWEGPGGTRTYTFGDALGDLQSSATQKPDATILPAMEQWIFVQALNRVVLEEGRRQRIPEDPDFRRTVDESVNGYLLQSYYTEEVFPKAVQEPNDLADVYARERNRFERLQGVTLDVIEFPDSAAAAAFTTHGAHSRTLRAAVGMIPGAPPVRTVEISFPTPDLDWARMQPTLAAMHPGDALGPVAVSQGRWRIFQVMARRTMVPSIDSLDVNTRGALEQEALEMGRERRLMQLLTELRARYRTEVHAERLRRVPWPVGMPGS